MCASLCALLLPHPACTSWSGMVTWWSHARSTQSHAGGVAHAGQRLNSLGEIVGEDSSVLSAAPIATHPGQGGAAHGVVDGLLSGSKETVRRVLVFFSITEHLPKLKTRNRQVKLLEDKSPYFLGKHFSMRAQVAFYGTTWMWCWHGEPFRNTLNSGSFTILIGVWYRKSQYWLMCANVLICSRISGLSESNKKRADVSLIDLIAPL